MNKVPVKKQASVTKEAKKGHSKTRRGGHQRPEKAATLTAKTVRTVCSAHTTNQGQHLDRGETNRALFVPHNAEGIGSAPHWMNEENARFILSATFSGKLSRPAPFEEIEQDCPAVWKQALQVFRGNRVAARRWLESRAPAFNGQRPYVLALRVGGRQKVLRELRRMGRAMNPHKRPGANMEKPSCK